MMASVTKQNYLKALYHLHQKDPTISLTDLGNALDVSKSTVNDMVKKLQVDGWLTYEKYKPIKLTKEGRKKAALIIRKHRLAEMYLMKMMGFGWEEVHEMAEELEHISSEDFFDRMDELMGFPTEDPHGSPIPDKNGKLIKPDYKILTQLKVGEKAKLKALRNSNTDFLIFLNKKDLTLGSEIAVLEIEAFDKSVTISNGKQEEIVLTFEVAKNLLVNTIHD